MSFCLWIRDFVSAPKHDPLGRLLRWGCVLVSALLVVAFARGLYHQAGAALGFGPFSVADQEEISIALAECGAVRAHLANFRSAPTRGDLVRVVAHCSAMEPLRQALALK